MGSHLSKFTRTRPDGQLASIYFARTNCHLNYHQLATLSSLVLHFLHP
jgi:hypothetical protein